MTRRIASTALMFLTMVALAFPVLAQDEEGRRRGGGRFGGRGRGGPQGPGGPGGFNRSSDMLMLQLLRSEEVREEIELLPDQEESFQKLAEQGRQERPDFARLRDASEDERRELMEKMRADMEARMKEAREKMEEILFPEQMARLNQIAIQAMGVGALSDPQVIAKLKITDAQQQEMESIRQASMNQLREMFAGGNREAERGSREEMREKLTEAREKMEKDILVVLDSDQLIALDDLKGEPFELSQSRGGFGRGPGGPGGIRGRRGAGGAGEAGEGGRPRRGGRPPRDN